MSQCSSTKKNGDRCTRSGLNHGLCAQHHPSWPARLAEQAERGRVAAAHMIAASIAEDEEKRYGLRAQLTAAQAAMKLAREALTGCTLHDCSYGSTAYDQALKALADCLGVP